MEFETPGIATTPASEVPEVDPPAFVDPTATQAMPSFEVDHGVDPDWKPGTAEPPLTPADSLDLDLPAETQSSEQAPPTPPAAPPLVAEEPRDAVFELPAEEPQAPVESPVEALPAEPVPPPTADEVTLTEVANDDDLFDDPSLDVARMSAGEEREILIPVEIGEGDAVQRFKLCVRLRLEPLDE
jgi:hypothetical protein